MNINDLIYLNIFINLLIYNLLKDSEFLHFSVYFVILIAKALFISMLFNLVNLSNVRFILFHLTNFKTIIISFDYFLQILIIMIYINLIPKILKLYVVIFIHFLN
jgi:hypothetical protein